MRGWKEIKIIDIANVVMGLSPKGSTYNTEDKGVPLLNGPTEFGAKYPTCTLYTTDSKRNSKPGDLLFCVRGSTTGRMNWADKVYSLGRGVCSIRGKTKGTTLYIKYCLDLFLNSLLTLAGGSTFPNLNKDDIEEFKIPLSDNFQKIVAVLSAYDDLIENNTRRIAIVEKMAEDLYREWFVKFRFPGHEKVKMVNSELGKIPEGWEYTILGKIAYTVKEKYIDDKHSQLPLLDLGRIPRKSLAISNYGKSNEIETSRIVFHKEDILFGSIRPYFHKVVFACQDGITNTSVFVIKANDDILKHYIFSVLFSQNTVDWATQHSGGMKMPVIAWDVFSKMKVILPSEENIKIFNEIIEPMFEEITILNNKNQILSLSREILLPKLISDEIDVEDLDIKAEDSK